MDPIILGLGWYVAFLFSTTAHEASHATVAWFGGDPTAYDGGQVSLNPLPHIQREPFGMIILPLIFVVLIGFPIGYAHAPYDPRWALRYPKRAAIMALAGPASNLVIALIAGLILVVGFHLGLWLSPGSGQGAAYWQLAFANDGSLHPLAVMLSMLFTLNILLALFNLFPFPPLDGAGVVPLFLSKQQVPAYTAFTSQPWVALIGMLLAWQLFPYIFRPVMQAAANALWYLA